MSEEEVLGLEQKRRRLREKVENTKQCLNAFTKKSGDLRKKNQRLKWDNGLYE